MAAKTEIPDLHAALDGTARYLRLADCLRASIPGIDLAFVHKDEDGTVSGLALTDLDGDGSLDLLEFEGASSGVLGQDEFDDAGEALEPGTSAAILVYENRWAAPLATALRKNGAQLVANGRIPVNALLAKLDELEAAHA